MARINIVFGFFVGILTAIFAASTLSYQAQNCGQPQTTEQAHPAEKKPISANQQGEHGNKEKGNHAEGVPSFACGVSGIPSAIVSLMDHHEGFVVGSFTGLLVVATVLLWLSTNKLWEAGERQIAVAQKSAEAADRSAKVAEDAMFVGNRPYVFVTSIRFDREFDIDKFDFEGEPIWPFFNIVVENHGATPATITQVCADSACVAKLPERVTYRTVATYRSTRMIIPSRSKLTLT